MENEMFKKPVILAKSVFVVPGDGKALIKLASASGSPLFGWLSK